jgi:hypothetical protein
MDVLSAGSDRIHSHIDLDIVGVSELPFHSQTPEHGPTRYALAALINKKFHRMSIISRSRLSIVPGKRSGGITLQAAGRMNVGAVESIEIRTDI